MTDFDPQSFWEERYRRGGGSGAGSRGLSGTWKVGRILSAVRRLNAESVADFGCGDGVALRAVRQLQGVAYLGLDFSPSIIARLKDSASDRIQFSLEDVAKRRKRKKYDLVLCLDVLHVAGHDPAVLDKIVKKACQTSHMEAMFLVWKEDRENVAPHCFYHPLQLPEGYEAIERIECPDPLKELLRVVKTG